VACPHWVHVFSLLPAPRHHGRLAGAEAGSAVVAVAFSGDGETLAVRHAGWLTCQQLRRLQSVAHWSRSQSALGQQSCAFGAHL
jgi:hypothetical protein